MASEIVSEIIEDVCLDPMRKKILRRSYNCLQLSVPKEKKRVCKISGEVAEPKSTASDISR